MTDKTTEATALQAGDHAPDFSMPTADGSSITLQNLRGKKVVLYFYPKDDTPGCTKEACAFRDNLPHFDKTEAVIIGVSKDSVDSHKKFQTKYDLNFPLASDESGTVCEDYGVWKEKNMYGKKYMGIERTTFLIDEKGIIQKVWKRVKVDGHAEAVQNAIQEMRAAA